jgi:hypothetical protein
VETPGIEIVNQETADERVVAYRTGQGTLRASWSLGPDGDWWQMEYPVKSLDDLPAARALVAARSYVPEAEIWTKASALVGTDGVAAVELPRRPYAELLHSLIGWSDGLMLFLGEGRQPLLQLMNDLEDRLQALVGALAGLDAQVFYSPDNLDAQFVSPRAFSDHLAESYRLTSQVLHQRGKELVVHAGGPVARLLPLLGATGVDAVEGICGPPQGDSTLAEAATVAGEGLTLWGGIPQDLLLATSGWEEFENGVRTAARDARALDRAVLGVADRVPVEAQLERLVAVPGILAGLARD